MAAQPKKPVYTYVDVPELSEAFVDSMRNFVFDGHTLRIEFTVTRFDNVASTAKKIPRCRLVLPRSGIIELMNNMTELRKILIDTKIITPAGAPTDQSPPQPLQ